MQLVVEILQIAGLVFFVLIILALGARATLKNRNAGKNDKSGAADGEPPARKSDEG